MSAFYGTPWPAIADGVPVVAFYGTPWPAIADGVPVRGFTARGFTFLESLRDVFDPGLRKDM